MTLEEYVLTYKVAGEVACSVEGYYDEYVKPLDVRFRDYSLRSSRTVICCFHGDTDPSLGLINHRHLEGVKVYHCFGCGRSGTVVRMHQLVQDMYHDRRLNDREACIELAGMYGIPLDDFEEVAEDDYDGRYVQTLRRIGRLQDSYTLPEFSRALRDVRVSGADIQDRMRGMNIEVVKMVATRKKLYS